MLLVASALAATTGCLDTLDPHTEEVLGESASELSTKNAADIDARSVINEELGTSDSELAVIYSASGDCSHGGIDVYENEWYEGASHFFCSGDFADLRKYTQGLGWWATWNDRISSALVNGQVRIVMYEDVNYGGNYKVFYPGQIIHFGGTIWNDAVSSMKIRYYP
jgi:hypothetical protein